MPKPNPYHKYTSKEDHLQHQVMTYFAYQYPEALVFHPMNEGKRTRFERFKFKFLGGMAGVSDIICFTPNAFKGGLAIELKVGSNKPTALQKVFLERLEKCNWEVHWCNTYEKAIEIIDNYFKKM
jgi:hypothetical protein